MYFDLYFDFDLYCDCALILFDHEQEKKQKKQKKIVVYKEYKYFISDPLSYSIWWWGCLRKITKFDKANEDWVSYVERMALFFEANRTEKEMKKKAILLFNVGLLSYKLLKSLSVPSKPSVISRIIKFLTYNKISTENKILAYLVWIRRNCSSR